MRIIMDFDFYFEGNFDNFTTLFTITKEEFSEAIRAVYDARDFILNSIYKNTCKNVYIVLTDLPVESEFACVDGDPYTKDVFIHLNLLTMIHEYKKEDSVLLPIIFKKKPSIYEFICFFLFHEVGHIVHFQLIIPGKMSLYEKMESHYVKYIHEHRRFDLKHRDILFDENNEVLQRAYRNLSTEKFADDFAHQLLADLLHES